MADISTIHSGLPLEEALLAFRRCCNTGPDRLFVTDGWLAPHLATLRRYISDPITEDQAHVLRGVVEKRESLERMGEWLAEPGELTWAAFTELLERRTAEARAEALAVWEADTVPRQREWYRAWTCGPLGGPYRFEWHRLPVNAPLTYYDRTSGQIAAAKRKHGPEIEPCPVCRTPVDNLRWQYAGCSTMQGLAGCEWRAWLVMCEQCEIGVAAFKDYFAIA